MKKLLLLIITLIAFSLSKAQLSPVLWGEEYEKEGGMTAQLYVLEFDEEFYYVVSYKKEERYLMKFDHTHTLIEITNLILSEDESLDKVDGVLKINNEVLIYNQQFDKESKIWNLYLAKFEGGKIVKQYEKVLTRDFSHLENLDWLPNFNFRFSQDSSKILMFNFLKNERKNGLEVIQLMALDSNFNVIWEKLQEFPYQDKRTVIQNTRISNEGEVYIGLKLKMKLLEKAYSVSNYDYILTKITVDSYKDHIVSFDDENVLPYKTTMHIDELDKRIITVGLYSNRLIYERQNGIYSYSTDFNLEQDKSYSREFTTDDLLGLVADNKAKKEKGLSKFFTLERYYKHLDGSFSLILEENYTTSYTNSNGYKKTTYHSDEIVIIRFNNDGTFNTLSKIDKEFKSKVEEITSFTSFQNKGCIYLMFNDQKSKNEREFIESKGGKFSRFTDVAKLDENGNIEFQKTLFTNKDVKGEFVPSRIEQFDNKLLIRTKRIGMSSLFVSKFSFGLAEIK